MIIPGFIALLFVIGRYFYRLAKRYDKNPIGFGLLGAGIGLVFISSSVIIGFYALFEFSAALSDLAFLLILLGILAFCIGCIIGSYKLVERQLKKNTNYKKSNPEILDL